MNAQAQAAQLIADFTPLFEELERLVLARTPPGPRWTTALRALRAANIGWLRLNRAIAGGLAAVPDHRGGQARDTTAVEAALDAFQLDGPPVTTAVLVALGNDSVQQWERHIVEEKAEARRRDEIGEARRGQRARSRASRSRSPVRKGKTEDVNPLLEAVGPGIRATKISDVMRVDLGPGGRETATKVGRDVRDALTTRQQRLLDTALRLGAGVIDLALVVGPCEEEQEEFFAVLQTIACVWLQAHHGYAFDEDAMRAAMGKQKSKFQKAATAVTPNQPPTLMTATPTRPIVYGVVRTPPGTAPTAVVATPTVAAPLAVAAPTPAPAPLAPAAPRQVCTRCGLNHDPATCRTALERLVCMRCGNIGHAMAICPT